MIPIKLKFRAGLKYILNTFGLLHVARRIRELFTPKNPSERERHQRFLQFKRNYGKVLRYNLSSTSLEQQKKVLVCGVGYPAVEPELGLIKALELAGYIPVVLTHTYSLLDWKYYRLAVKHGLADVL